MEKNNPDNIIWVEAETMGEAVYVLSKLLSIDADTIYNTYKISQ